MNALNITVAVIAIIVAISVFSVLGQVIGYVFGVGVIVFLIALCIDPEKTKNYSLKVIDAASDICNAVRSKFQ